MHSNLPVMPLYSDEPAAYPALFSETMCHLAAELNIIAQHCDKREIHSPPKVARALRTLVATVATIEDLTPHAAQIVSTKMGELPLYSAVEADYPTAEKHRVAAQTNLVTEWIEMTLCGVRPSPTVADAIRSLHAHAATKGQLVVSEANVSPLPNQNEARGARGTQR